MYLFSPTIEEIATWGESFDRLMRSNGKIFKGFYWVKKKIIFEDYELDCCNYDKKTENMACTILSFNFLMLEWCSYMINKFRSLECMLLIILLQFVK